MTMSDLDIAYGLLRLPTAIESIAVAGYKSLVRTGRIAIRPLTLLAGANSSGKSSLMQPLLLLKQTLEAPFDPGALRLDGPHVTFGSARQFLPLGLDPPPELRIEIGTSHRRWLDIAFAVNPDGRLDIEHAGYDIAGRKLTLRPADHGDTLAALRKFEPAFLATVEQMSQRRVAWRVERDRCFLQVGIDAGPGFTALPGIPPNDHFSHPLFHLLHVPGLRGNPERLYRVAAVENAFPGPFHLYTASVVDHWQRIEDPRRGRLNAALRALGLTRALEARPLDAVHVELLVDRRSGGRATGADGSDLVSMADVGFGISQVLPVLVALLAAEPGQLVYLEQPELHLHPRAQQALAGILAEAAERGARVVVETHSDTLLLAIQSLVAEGALAPEKVKLHWFSRNRQGVTKIASADLDANGAYGDWPEDFGAVDAEVQNRYLTAVEARARVGEGRRAHKK